MSDGIQGFVCTKCGECCCGFSEDEGILLFPEDLDRISTKINIPLESFKAKYCYQKKLITEKKTITLYLLRDVNGKCIFLDNSNLCKIYEFRPIQCQKLPFHYFWNNNQRFKFECMKNVKIPENWSTKNEDRKLVSTLFNDEIN